jgi:exopolyphosphatase / guanosine-5'-triphosphate,3'-diphosphate pyrophosphatase
VRRACIDIGSNTTRLLVASCAEGAVDTLYQERAFTSLGWNRPANGAIAAAKLAEVAAVVAAQVNSARRFGCGEVRVVATEAIRRAANRDQLAARIREVAGVELEVLTEAEEARLAFVGAARAFREMSTGELGVVDVGGGSSELVVGQVPDQVRWSVSLPLGSGELATEYLHSDPPTPAELAAARRKVTSIAGELDVPHPAAAAAVGGSAASLASLAGQRLDAAAFARALGQLAAAPRREVAQRFGLEVERVTVLPAGLLILQAAAELFRAPLVVAGGGLREGVLMEAVDG